MVNVSDFSTSTTTCVYHLFGSYIFSRILSYLLTYRLEEMDYFLLTRNIYQWITLFKVFGGNLNMVVLAIIIWLK